MASIERTAYPRFPRVFTVRDLHQAFTPAADEVEWATSVTRLADRRLALLVQLKCFRFLHHFPPVAQIPEEVIEHVSASLGIVPQKTIRYPQAHRALYRHHEAVRAFLGIRPFSGNAARKLAAEIAREASAVVDTRPDIINILVERLILLDYELPAFSTLVKIAEQAHEVAQRDLFGQIHRRLGPSERQWLDDLLSRELPLRQSQYNQIKRSAKKASRKHLDLLLDQLTWLKTLPDSDLLLNGVPVTKLAHMANIAAVLDAREMKDLSAPKRHALMLALIRQMRIRAKDDIGEMFLRRMAIINKRAREELVAIQTHQRELSEDLVAKLEQVMEILAEDLPDAPTGQKVRGLLAPNGNLDKLREDCTAIRVWSGGNHLPLLWKPFSSHRAALFRMARSIDLQAATQDSRLLEALYVIMASEHRKTEWIADEVDLSFASDRWRKLVRRSHGHGNPTNRRYLEICVFTYLASDLRCGDICIEGSETFADYRTQLMPWSECQAHLPAYCERVGIGDNAQAFVADLKQLLKSTADQVDKEFPNQAGDVVICSNGEPILKRPLAKEVPATVFALQSAIETRLAPRNLLDILANIEHWTGFTRHFGPLSGNDPKLRNARERYLLTVFAMGCNLGPNQASRHLSNGVSPHQLSFVNRRHMSLEQLDDACRDLAELYLRLELPKLWGEGKKVAADGTQYDFYDQNLLVGMHFRYRKMGAVAYRHVADNYIAVFRHFIPPGVLEAVYVIEGLLKAGLSVQADTVYSDTHGQSETVFAFTHLLGIQLMPRIRNWKDLTFYRPDKGAKYRHIDRLFTEVANWDLIQDHWQDLMQVAISIQSGRIASPMLLRKLSHEGRHNRLFTASRELGRVLRTVYLLRWISSKAMRQEVTGTTNKIESYHSFTKWLDFGGDVITENDPVEQQKRVRYIDLVASAVILQNTVDIMKVLEELMITGEAVSPADAAQLSPYMTSGIKRFGNYHLDMKRPPEPWVKESQFRDAVRQARAAAGLAARRSAEELSGATA